MSWHLAKKNLILCRLFEQGQQSKTVASEGEGLSRGQGDQQQPHTWCGGPLVGPALPRTPLKTAHELPQEGLTAVFN